MLRMKWSAIGFRQLSVAMIVLGFSGLGCNRRESADEALNRALAATNTPKSEIAKFSGTVTIDGQPPGIKVYDKHRILIMLYDPKNPPSSTNPILYVDCMPEPNDGSFEFSTYNRGDGVPPGSYIALFLDMQTSWGGGYKGTDRFKNRFNDPDKNEASPQFKVDLTDSGNADWQFNLVTEDNPPPAAPGPKTVFGPGK
jgi:hypothetical protein